MDYEEYLKERNRIVKDNSNIINIELNDKEQKVDKIIQEYKEEALNEISESHIAKASTLRDTKIKETKLYKLLLNLPKGSDLHVHGLVLLPAHKFIEFIRQYDDILINIEDYRVYLKDQEHDKNKCFSVNEILSKNLLTYKDLIDHYTILSCTHNENVWQYFYKLFKLPDNLKYNTKYLYEYYVYAFKYYLSLNIFHIEIHIVLYSDYDRSYEMINTIRQAYYDCKKEHNELVVSIIGAGNKYNGVDFHDTRSNLEITIALKENLKDDFDKNNIHDFIIGFDLVNEEDTSIPLKDIAPMLLEFKSKYPDFDYFLHSGESLIAESDNLIDAYLIGATRVGHGMNLYRYPKLLENYKDNKICLEVCLVSNQALRYVRDIRLHPALEYFRRGVSIAICSDDPAFLEENTLVDDYFASITNWDLNLAEIKQLALNSIIYSGVDKTLKNTLLVTFNDKWNKFINSFK